MPFDQECEIYNKIHTVSVLYKNEVCSERNLLINISEYNDVLVKSSCAVTNF